MEGFNLTVMTCMGLGGSVQENMKPKSNICICLEIIWMRKRNDHRGKNNHQNCQGSNLFQALQVSIRLI